VELVLGREIRANCDNVRHQVQVFSCRIQARTESVSAKVFRSAVQTIVKKLLGFLGQIENHLGQEQTIKEQGLREGQGGQLLT